MNYFRDNPPSDGLELIKRLKDIVVQHTTGNYFSSSAEYTELRRIAATDPSLKQVLPQIIKDCGNLGEVYSVMKGKFPTYRERREYLRTEFLPLIQKLEAVASGGDGATTAALSKVDWDHVQSAWQKALARRETDPEGAITAARTMLETVCKHVLDSQGLRYNDSGDLQSLYTAAAKSLDLAPTAATESALRHILSGCITVVNGMSALRNKSGDAHGKGLADDAAERRHAELAVNIAGAVSSFLVRTYSATRSK